MGRRLGRRELLHGLAAGLGALGRPAWLRAEESAYEAMARAALAFLGALDRRRRRQATFPFAHAERQNWHSVPRRREGVPLKDMPADARMAALALLQVGLSAAGYAKARDVLRLEGVLRQLETFGGFTRDPDNYAVAIFGAPEQPAPGGGGSRATISP